MRSTFTNADNHFIIMTFIGLGSKNMYKNLAILATIFVFALSANAQTIAPSSKDTEAAAKLEKDAVEFLRETSVEVERLRTAENRISFNSELASLMWFHDEKEAKLMYGGVIADFKQLLMQFDMQMNNQVVDPDDAKIVVAGGVAVLLWRDRGAN